ncbi:hypothetical protein K503DRAFT_867985 [Rhizopogon vinicolor AM-OR11-026]|uniref:Uncharacterized protein n=1 Tax=Rhizopogon vinicolor AM-OR11-026 TaxID=1314800 RepID=A0A1B7MTB8_9AGAM|nr:hypothetical protein K503DRAFT_867985 [Rhizopogon vinicolor AM-OR11-026]
MVDTDSAKSKREFKKLSKNMDDKLDKEKGRAIESLEPPDFKRNASIALICQRAVEHERSREAFHNARPGIIKQILPAPCEDLEPSLVVLFDELDYEQSIANDHPNDLESGPSSPHSVSPSYLRHRRQSKSTSRHRSHTTTDGSTSHLLARLIARDDEVREIDALLVVTSERLETESNRANTSERRALGHFSRLHQATEGRDRAEQEAARLREELKLYKMQLDNAERRFFKSEAEAEAARARTKARKLLEEKPVIITYEEGRHR